MKYSYPTLSEVGDSSALILDLNQIVFLKKTGFLRNATFGFWKKLCYPNLCYVVKIRSYTIMYPCSIEIGAMQEVGVVKECWN